MISFIACELSFLSLYVKLCLKVVCSFSLFDKIVKAASKP